MTSFVTDDERWEACLSRERQADGVFFMMVRTTGIFCRPTCPARPQRRNVRFIETAAEAIRLGYRPCKRCRPGLLHPATKNA